VADEAGQIRTDELDPQAEARRRRALTQIRHYPDPALRLQARDVEEFDSELAGLVKRLRDLMSDANGVGLAATQIGILRRVFVFVHEGETVALVNPRIVERAEETEVDEEGCLSLQGVLIPVERNLTVTLEAKTPDGGDVRLELSELAARVAQHEVDHLDGVLILDRTTAESRREALAVLRPQPLLSLS
jgi:peptide deformylase